MMKQKKCKCLHKSGSDRSIKSYTYIAVGGGGGNCGGNNGSTTLSNISNAQVDEKPSLSRQCANNWWKLKLADRKRHNEYMKIQLLSPFLFCKVYQSDVWVDWAKKAGLLTQKRIDNLDELSDEEIHHTNLMELAITKLQEKIIEYNDIKPSNTPIPQYLEEIIDDIKSVEETLETLKFETAINKVYNKHWFKSVRKQLPDVKTKTDHVLSVNNYAVFLVAWQVCFYMRSVYREKPLEEYEKDSKLDSTLEIVKQEGNKYFKDEDYTEAIRIYTNILCKKPYLYIIYGNRAVCYLKTQEYRLALADGRRAVALCPTWDKGQYRYAQSYYELGKFEETMEILSKAIKLCSSGNLISLQKATRKAMTGEETFCANPSETLNATVNGIVEIGEETDEYANMPDLIYSDSDNEGESDQSDNEIPLHENALEHIPPTVTETKKEETAVVPFMEKEKVKKKRRRKTKSVSIIETPMKLERGELITMMKEGSSYLLDAKTEFAVREYKRVFCILQSDPDIISNSELAILHYSLGWAYQESGSSLEEESLEEFQAINRKYPDMNFPLSFYGKGLVYHKQYRFRQCIEELQEARRMCDMPDCILNCCWPGVDTVIEVSVPANFKLAIEHFLNLCCHPPKPDAVCRYMGCNYQTADIYVNNPDFKGFHRFICTENCHVEYHPNCWKKYKNEKQSKEKDFWKKVCFTPDCYGAILTFQIYDSKYKKTHEEVFKDCNSLKKESDGFCPKDLSDHSREVYNKKVRKKDTKASPTDKHVGEDTSSHIISKEEKRRRRHSSMSDKDQEGDDSPRYRNDDPSKGCVKDKEDDNSAGYFTDGFDISKYNNFVTDANATALDIFKKFEQLLDERGSIDVVNCVSVRTIMDTLDDNSKLLIGQMGSLRALLAHCPKISFDDKNKNAIYLTAQEEVFKKSKRKCLEESNCLVPTFHDPLFNEELNDINGQLLCSEDPVSIKTNDVSASEEPVNNKTRIKKKSESSDKDDPMVTSAKNLKKNNLESVPQTRIKDPVVTKLPSTNGRKLRVSSDVTEAVMEEIDCTKSNENTHAKTSKTKKKQKSISDIIIFNDAKKGEEVEYKIINNSDPPSPRKKEKKKKVKTRSKNDISGIAHDRPPTPPGEKSKLRTYLEDKIEAEKHNKEARYCCPLLGENCSCAEIERFKDDTAKSSNRRVRVMKVITIEPEGKESDSDSDDDSNDALANVLEMIQSKNSKKKAWPSSEAICVGEVGIQCDLNNVKKVENEKEQLKSFNEDLMKRLKEMQMTNEKNSLDFQKQKERQQNQIGSQQAEIKSHKTALEKLRKELVLCRKAHNEEMKKCRSDHEEAVTFQTEDLSSKVMKIEELNQLVGELKAEKMELQKIVNDNARRQVEEVGKLIRKEEEVEALRSELNGKDGEMEALCSEKEWLSSQTKEMKKRHAQEKMNHEEIVNRLTNSITEQIDRTQKVQVAFLEVKKEIVAVKYQQQAAIVQNTINQMQYWPAVPEIQNIRSVWDDFKKHFQICYEKMQEEFKDVVLKVKDGQPLEDLPPAKYAEPPPFPKTPMPNNVAPYFGQQTPQRMSNPPPGYKPTSIQTAPPGIPHMQQRPVLGESMVLSSSNDASPCLQTRISASSSEESINEKVENTVTSIKADAQSTRVKNTIISSGINISMNTTAPSPTSTTNMLSAKSGSSSSLNGSDISIKSSSSVGSECKNLDFASTVKGVGCDAYSSSPTSGGLKATATATEYSAQSSGFITESEDSDIVLGKNGEPKNKMFDRIIMRLGSLFPSFTREELRFYTCEYRRMQLNGSLSGMKFDDLILNLEKMIRTNKSAAKQNPSKGSNQRSGSDTNQKKKLAKSAAVEIDSNTLSKAKRTRANHTPVTKPSSQESSSWSEAVSRSTKNEVFGQEEPCVICYEDMCQQSVSKLHCGHIFHRTCITCWLNEQRTCPICRVHALLPEEYPTLG